MQASQACQHQRWDTRFKNYNWMLLAGTVSGALYVLRTFAGGSLCPFGDPDIPSQWSFDYCADEEASIS
jgi:hypothetical protein